ncbi:histidinol-phosphate transaminase [Sulfurospirillum arsenophilum]|uniref:histidinol-phosphate transaminase n=1 Tax=Sulfurospirillum arsenophilum TaxID=56698 RepID=UPI0005A7A44A|nr:histidinol-phosphate transaminase [Sulfurospirillum arsenophilum]
MQFNGVLDQLKIYEAGKPIELVVREYGIESKDVIKLASNENPRGCSPKVIEAVRNEAAKMNLYPDDSMYELKEALAKKYAVKEENIIIGAGSDQVISFAVHAKANANTKVLMAGITFAMYEIYALQTGATILKTPTAGHNLKEMLEIYKANKDISVIFLCLPNNPLGECLDTKDVYAFLDQISPETLVVIDGAYQEYASFKDPAKKIVPSEIIAKYPNTLYSGTFSKAYGLGGMRCGYGIAQPEVIKALLKLRAPFNITNLTLKAAIVALSDQAFVDASVKENFEEMKAYEAFAKELGFKVIESYTNFIVLEFDANKNSGAIAQKLMEKGIIVRNLGSYGMNAIRVTIGTPEQNARFFELFKIIYM